MYYVIAMKRKGTNGQIFYATNPDNGETSREPIEAHRFSQLTDAMGNVLRFFASGLFYTNVEICSVAYVPVPKETLKDYAHGVLGLGEED